MKSKRVVWMRCVVYVGEIRDACKSWLGTLKIRVRYALEDLKMLDVD